MSHVGCLFVWSPLRILHFASHAFSFLCPQQFDKICFSGKTAQDLYRFSAFVHFSVDLQPHSRRIATAFTIITGKARKCVPSHILLHTPRTPRSHICGFIEHTLTQFHN